MAVAVTTENIKILLVEDDPLVLYCLSRIFAREGYLVIQAEDLRQARKALVGGPVNAIIADNVLPDGSGVDLLRQVQRLNPNTLRIMHSGTPPEGLNQLVGQGVIQHFALKPGHQHLVELLQRAVWREVLERAS
jgi:two-component system NtrC family response regulator